MVPDNVSSPPLNKFEKGPKRQTNKKSNGFDHIQCLSDQPAAL